MKRKPQGTVASLGWTFVSLRIVLEGGPGLVWCFTEPGKKSPSVSVLLHAWLPVPKSPHGTEWLPKLQPFCLPSRQQEGMREKGRKATSTVSLFKDTF